MAASSLLLSAFLLAHTSDLATIEVCNVVENLGIISISQQLNAASLDLATAEVFDVDGPFGFLKIRHNRMPVHRIVV